MDNEAMGSEMFQNREVRQDSRFYSLSLKIRCLAVFMRKYKSNWKVPEGNEIAEITEHELNGQENYFLLERTQQAESEEISLFQEDSNKLNAKSTIMKEDQCDEANLAAFQPMSDRRFQEQLLKHQLTKIRDNLKVLGQPELKISSI